MSFSPHFRAKPAPGARGDATGPRAAIALERALLCLDCEAIYEMGGGPCPACGSHAAWAVGRLLSRPAAA